MGRQASQGDPHLAEQCDNDQTMTEDVVLQEKPNVWHTCFTELRRPTSQTGVQLLGSN